MTHPAAVPDILDTDFPQFGCYVLERVDGALVPLWDWIHARLASPYLPGKATLQQAVTAYRRRHPFCGTDLYFRLEDANKAAEERGEAPHVVRVDLR